MHLSRRLVLKELSVGRRPILNRIIALECLSERSQPGLQTIGPSSLTSCDRSYCLFRSAGQSLIPTLSAASAWNHVPDRGEIQNGEALGTTATGEQEVQPQIMPFISPKLRLQVLTSLVDACLRTTICFPQIPRYPGISLTDLDPPDAFRISQTEKSAATAQHGLAQLSPSLFSPNYLQVLSAYPFLLHCGYP